MSPSRREPVVREGPLNWRQLADVAAGSPLVLSASSKARIAASRKIVDALVERGIRAYGVNTGVGALADTVVPPEQQRALSRNLLMSHAVGVGDPLGRASTRALLAAAVNNHAHGYSGIRLEVVEALLALMNADCLPVVPSRGSVGYLTHMAHASLPLIGEGFAALDGEVLTGADALWRLGLEPLVLEAKEGLSLVNGAPCAAGFAAIAIARTMRLLDWADAAAALTVEALGGQMQAFDAQSLALRMSPGLQEVGERLRRLLQGSAVLAAAAGKRTQDPLSLRAVPHVHGAARDMAYVASDVVDRELQSVTDNPAVAGSPEAPLAFSEAHAVAPALGLAMDSLAIAVAEVAAMAERRIDRLVNPLVSGLPAFLAVGSGAASGFMIAQYTAVALVADNRRLAAPASLDGGVTSGLQEDHLAHATAAAWKMLSVLGNAERVVGLELLAAAQAHDLARHSAARAEGTEAIYQAVRACAKIYADDRPLAGDMDAAAALVRRRVPPA